jgi:hypothetical protein
MKQASLESVQSGVPSAREFRRTATKGGHVGLDTGAKVNDWPKMACDVRAEGFGEKAQRLIDFEVP